MKPAVFIKGLTLFSFILLISTFLLYRAGKFNAYLFDEEPVIQISHNGGKILTTRITGYDSIKQTRLSSSKSLVLTDNDPISINKRKREYLTYMLIYRSEYFQDSLRKLAKPLPGTFLLKADSIRFDRKTNWFNAQ
jgi:hypothetical protein